MALRSILFKADQKLQACAASNPAHVTPGAVGPHVAKIQAALIELDDLRIDPAELATKRYGPSTARAVLSYKTKRQIINRSYQSSPDNIVGIMTIASLDEEMIKRQQRQTPVPSNR